MAIAEGDVQTVVVHHFRVVRSIEAGGGIIFTTSDREHGWDAEAKAQDWMDRHAKGACHLEEWTQTYTVSAAKWEQVR